MPSTGATMIGLNESSPLSAQSRLTTNLHELPEREALYAEFQPLVQRLIRQYGGDAELKQDLRGEIYYRFCRLLEEYDASRGIPLRPYLVRMLTTAVYTYARSHWRRGHREMSLEADTLSPALQSDPSRDWDDELRLKDVVNSLPEAIAKLPTRQKQVVIWRYYDSLAFEDIADRLRIRPATARSLLRHGLNNLRRVVAGSTPVDD